MMTCQEIKEKLLTRKANMDEEQILKEVMMDFSKGKIEEMTASGMDEEEIRKAMKDTINAVLRRRKIDYMNEIQYDNPRIRNLVGSILGIIDSNYSTGRKSGITQYEIRNVLRQQGQVADMYKNILHDRWIKLFNGVKDGEVPADPTKFFRDPKRAANLKQFLLTGETVGDNVEMQLQLKIKSFLEDEVAKELRVEPQAIIDAAIMGKVNLYMQYRRISGGVPFVRSRLLGERRYAFIQSSQDSENFKIWFNKNFEDIVPDASDRDKLFKELFGYNKSLLSDFDPRDTTTLGGINKYTSLRKAGILNDDIVRRWAELSAIDGEEILENLHGKTTNVYGILNAFGNKPLRNSDAIKNVILTATGGRGDISSQNAINETFKNYDGMLKYAMGDRSNIEPSLLMDAVDILVGTSKMFKSPLMAFRQMDDYTVRNFFMKKYSNKSTAATISDDLKYAKRAMFGDDYEKLSVKDKEIVLGVGTSMADTLFGRGDSLTRFHAKDGGLLGRGADLSYTYLSGMAYHERVFERAGMLHTSSIIKGLQNENFSDIMKLDLNNRSSRGTLRRALSEVGITEREWNLFREIKYSTEYFSSEETLEWLRKNPEKVKALLKLGDDNMDFYTINRYFDLITASLLPFDYDVETGFLTKGAKEKLIDGAYEFYRKQTNVSEEMIGSLDFARQNLESIQYINHDLVFRWKKRAVGLDILKDDVEKNLRNQFKDARVKLVNNRRTGEYSKILKKGKERNKIISDYNNYFDSIKNEKLLNKLLEDKIESVNAKFQDLRNNMFQESSVLRFDYWDRYMADRAMGDTRNAAINKMFSFYKSALWKNTERLAGVFRDYDVNGELGVKSFFNRYAAADYISYASMASLFGTANLLLSGDILAEDKDNVLANYFTNVLFVGTGLYMTAPMKILDGLSETASGAMTLDSRRFIAGLNYTRRQLTPTTVRNYYNYAEALYLNYFDI